MLHTVRTGLATLILSGLAAMAVAPAQQAPAGKADAPPARRAPTAAEKAKLDQVLATVNGEPVTRGQFLQFISQYQVNPGSEGTAYSTGMDILINTRLLAQFLNQNKVPVDQAELDKIIAEQRKAAAENNTSLESILADNNMTLDQMRETLKTNAQWRGYIEKTASDAKLKQYAEANPDVFNGAQVKASHIQINLDEDASEADKAAAREKLGKIKKEILSQSITFADAANKYSEDPANKEQPSGGDLRWFPRKKFTEAFSTAAFSLPKGAISDPVETEYGLHLIQVVDRRDGKMPPLEQIKEKVMNTYAMDEQNRIVADMRKKAKIEIKPLPADLFGPKPTEAAPKAAAATAPKAATPKP